MVGWFIHALPLALLFMTLSNQWGWDGFLVGYITGVAILALVGGTIEQRSWKTLPVQVFWLVVYTVQLAWSIVLSSVDVARRVLDPRLPIQPGEVIVPTQDPHPLIGALSAHAITTTPGELVVDLNEREMLVHTLDVEATRGRIDEEQTNRMQILRRIIGEKQS